MALRRVRMSLEELLGREYLAAVCAAQAALGGMTRREAEGRAAQQVDLFPAAFAKRLDALLPRVGQQVCAPLTSSAAGATTAKFQAASKLAAAPLSARGPYRIGEDGRLYLTTKSEHYHAPLGHAFPGYRLLALARELGIPNATHNNTRGRVPVILVMGNDDGGVQANYHGTTVLTQMMRGMWPELDAKLAAAGT